MKGGMVVRLRVAPKDCMSIIDAAQTLGIQPTQYSMSALTSLVLSSLLEVQRKAGTVPTRSGFEYLSMMEPYTNRKGVTRQKMTDALYKGQLQGAIGGLSQPAPITPISATAEGKTTEELMVEFKELHERWETLTAAEMTRYNDLNALLFS